MMLPLVELFTPLSWRSLSKIETHDVNNNGYPLREYDVHSNSPIQKKVKL